MPTNKAEHRELILDTHAWIWLMMGDSKVQSTKILKVIQEVSSHSKILVSIISVWEVSMLEAKKRISFPYSCLEWVQKALRAPHISLAALTPEIAVASARLPGIFHGDPADRIIVATALAHQAAILTADKEILQYAQKQSLPAISISV